MDFVYTVIHETAPLKFKDTLISLNIDATVETALSAAKDKLRKVLKDKTRHSSTYNLLQCRIQ
jgi:hypothetical protein